ncbi:MAG: hypothetical protein KC416_02975 [Myxococcales bacterium]|nr:hypothetical protein [Myxococcales bacterium]
MQRILSVLFFLSGSAALVYQVAWQRALFRVFGINLESTTVVVSVFMLGLGGGAFLGAWISSQIKEKHLALFAAVELAIAGYGFFSLELFAFAGRSTVALGPLERVLVVGTLLLLPTLLMGATLPVLVEHVVQRHGNLGAATARLYGINTMGSAVSSFLTVFLIFGVFGMQGTVWFACIINVVVATGVWLMPRTNEVSAQ